MEGCAKHSSIFFEFELPFGAFLLPSQTVLHVHYLDISLNVQAKSRVQCGMFSFFKEKTFHHQKLLCLKTVKLSHFWGGVEGRTAPGLLFTTTLKMYVTMKYNCVFALSRIMFINLRLSVECKRTHCNA